MKNNYFVLLHFETDSDEEIREDLKTLRTDKGRITTHFPWAMMFKNVDGEHEMMIPDEFNREEWKDAYVKAIEGFKKTFDYLAEEVEE